MKKHLKNVIAFLITVFFTILVIKSVDLHQSLQAFKLFNLIYTLPLVGIFLIIMIFRTQRWNILMKNNSVKFGDVFDVYMVSNLLNIFLPARAGDVFRGCYFGQKYGISKMKLLGSVAAERILDGLTVVLILMLGIILYGKSPFLMKLAVMSSAMFVFSFLFFLWIYKHNKIDVICEKIKGFAVKIDNNFGKILYNGTEKIRPFLNSFIKGFEAFSNPKTLLKVSFISIFAWFSDCILIYFLLIAFGIKVDFALSLFIISFSALSTILPSSSIYVGLYQYAFILAFGLYNLESSVALSFSLVEQGIVLLTYFVVFIIFIIKNRKNLLEFKQKEADKNGQDT